MPRLWLSGYGAETAKLSSCRQGILFDCQDKALLID
jgi:hypothetical protein